MILRGSIENIKSIDPHEQWITKDKCDKNDPITSNLTLPYLKSNFHYDYLIPLLNESFQYKKSYLIFFLIAQIYFHKTKKPPYRGFR